MPLQFHFDPNSVSPDMAEVMDQIKQVGCLLFVCLELAKISITILILVTKYLDLGEISVALTHCRLNELTHTIYWKSPVSILDRWGYEIWIFLEKNG